VTDITFRVASSMDDLFHVTRVRGAAFLSRGEPYDEEFDGLDLHFCCHLLALLPRDVPIATMRLRWIGGGDMVWERLAITPSVRGSIRLLFDLTDLARKVTKEKGCTTVIGYVADRSLMKFWQRRGAVFQDEYETYNGTLYQKMTIDLTQDL
jgi:hypothetical protein